MLESAMRNQSTARPPKRANPGRGTVLYSCAAIFLHHMTSKKRIIALSMVDRILI
jgi:hypothetical protein